MLFASPTLEAQSTLQATNTVVQPKMVKVYGAGGPGRLEAYQSGFLISEDGYILTARSYVLDIDEITIVLNDGSRYVATQVGSDPIREIAVLKIEASGLSFFNLDEATKLEPGDSVLAFSNLYGVATGNEPTSVLSGIVSAVTPLSARRGLIKTAYQGPVYIIDAMTNNPGAAGGAVTDVNGNLVAIVGKELRSAESNIWINFGMPIDEVQASVDDIRSGRLIPRARMEDARRVAEPMTLALLGLVLVPDVLPSTPPYIDSVVPNSAADQAGMRPDDLILFVGDRLMTSRRLVVEELEFHHRDDPLDVVIQRDDQVLSLSIDLNRRAR